MAEGIRVFICFFGLGISAISAAILAWNILVAFPIVFTGGVIAASSNPMLLLLIAIGIWISIVGWSLVSSAFILKNEDLKNNPGMDIAIVLSYGLYHGFIKKNPENGQFECITVNKNWGKYYDLYQAVSSDEIIFKATDYLIEDYSNSKGYWRLPVRIKDSFENYKQYIKHMLTAYNNLLTESNGRPILIEYLNQERERLKHVGLVLYKMWEHFGVSIDAYNKYVTEKYPSSVVPLESLEQKRQELLPAASAAAVSSSSSL